MIYIHVSNIVTCIVHLIVKIQFLCVIFFLRKQKNTENLRNRIIFILETEKWRHYVKCFTMNLVMKSMSKEDEIDVLVMLAEIRVQSFCILKEMPISNSTCSDYQTWSYMSKMSVEIQKAAEKGIMIIKLQSHKGTNARQRTWHLHPCGFQYMYMKSLIPKGAKSTFVTSEKNMFLCASLYPRTSLWKTQNWIYNVFFLLVIFGSEMQIEVWGIL